MSRKSSKLSYHGSPNRKQEDQEVINTQNEQLLPHNQQQNDDDDDDDDEEEKQELIPGLPDHIAHLILTKIPPSKLYSVCHLWRNFIYSPLFPPFYSLYTLLTPIANTTTLNSLSSPSNPQQLLTNISFFTFDPISSQWQPLPPAPPLSLLLRHPPFISRDLPVQSVAVCDRLAVVAGTTQDLTPALPRPLVFDPLTRVWGYGPLVPAPRRWCATGALNGSLYVVSGIGPHFSTDTARSVEKWDVLRDRAFPTWEKLGPLRDGRFSREAADAIGWRGRLCMVNVKGDTAKQGVVYSALHDSWGDMKDGMIAGWRGPAASMHEDVIYVVDESKGVVRKYVEERDAWVDVFKNERLRGAKQMAAGGGRLCVVCGGGTEIVVVDVVATPPRMWVVEPPHGFNVAAVHVLPRMCGVHSSLNLL